MVECSILDFPSLLEAEGVEEKRLYRRGCSKNVDGLKIEVVKTLGGRAIKSALNNFTLFFVLQPIPESLSPFKIILNNAC